MNVDAPMPDGTSDCGPRLRKHFRLLQYGTSRLLLLVGWVAVLAQSMVAPRALDLVMEWATAHQPELAEDWRLAADGREPLKIPPLA